MRGERLLNEERIPALKPAGTGKIVRKSQQPENLTQSQWQQRIRALSFVVMDIALFLDTHPSSEAALNYYAKYNTMLLEALAAYESQYGPIDIHGVDIEEGWTWIDQPWPWEVKR